MVLDTLRAGHPRLIALETDIARVRRLIEQEPFAGEIYERLHQSAEKLIHEPPVEYKIVGPRLLTQSRRCLDRVYTLATMFRLTGEERFAQRAVKEMLTAAVFPDWNPSHFLDTAEMTHALAIGYDWLFDFMDTETQETVREAIIEKGIQQAIPFYDEQKWWVRVSHNWNQVCNGGIGIGALAVAEHIPELAEKVLENALESIRLPMSQYAPDGGWDEGPGYWHYATRYNVYFLAALESALGTDFDLSQIEGFSRTGDFRVYFIGPTNRTFSYADAGDGAGSAEEMFWLAGKFDKPLYSWHQRQYARHPHALDLWWFDPRGDGPRADATPLDALFQGVDVAFFRSAWEDKDTIFIGFKGGDNKANHSHLDLGSFVLDALGYRWAVDLGSDDYNLPGYFGKQRWEYYRLRTESHNTLLINRENQLPNAHAPITAFRSEPQWACAIADLSEAYPAAQSVKRGMALVDRRSVLVQDEIVSEQPLDIEWGMLTPGAITVQGNVAILSQGKARLAVEILAPQTAYFEVLGASPPPPEKQQLDIRKLVIRLPQEMREPTLSVLLTPYHIDEKPAPAELALRPLEQWD